MKDTSDTILANLEEEGDYYIAARGGAGGKGNSSFATSTDTAPHVAELGAEGESRELQVELRVMAHAGLVSRRILKFSLKLSRVMRKPTFWLLTCSDINQTVQLQKMARGLKFRI